jgi:hypothetical protein
VKRKIIIEFDRRPPSQLWSFFIKAYVLGKSIQNAVVKWNKEEGKTFDKTI